MTISIGKTIERQRLTVQGLVQGVGFRPFIYNQAQKLGLSGFVLNNSAGVIIEIEGTPETLVVFYVSLHEKAPPLARIDSVVTEQLIPLYETIFAIAYSEVGSERHALIAPDAATCAECLSEVFNPADRRYKYPFINCTNCGPRFTIVQDVPYDRPLTTMRIFPMCAECQTEYDDPTNRRFHAQPNACAACGPQLRLLDAKGQILNLADQIGEVARQLARGAIVAVKGLGGYHLACDAFNQDAVTRLRQRKHREAKPFALMVQNLETASKLCEVNEEEAGLLQSHRRPIVLLQKRGGVNIISDVSPGVDTLGLMLPYTPLHHLLLQAYCEFGRVPALVMTSGNQSDEPIAYRDEEAQITLALIADFYLTHNRPIHMRCDDSVVRMIAGGTQIFRRSRGYAPEPVTLPLECPIPILACGGQLKNTFALAKGRQAFLSHHIGDLENLETLNSFKEGINHFGRLFDIMPQAVAYDLHPDYLASRHALELNLPHKIGVQHHHAHIASVLAEHGLNGPVIGVAADGTGYGQDECIWGCEIMVASLKDFERLAHLAYIPLPGGEQAIAQPWRIAAVYLSQTFGPEFVELDIPFTKQLDQRRWRTLAQMIERGLNCPLASSLGRLFDAVAALLGVRSEVYYEGQAAIELEALVAPGNKTFYPFTISEEALATIDVTPMIRAIVSDLQQQVEISQIAGRFHHTVTEMLAQSCIMVRLRSGLNEVALSGGVFQNRHLMEQLSERLNELGFRVLLNRLVPPNDGGLSLGQVAVAAARLSEMNTK